MSRRSSHRWFSISAGSILLGACASVPPESSSAPQSKLLPGALSPGAAGPSAGAPSSAASPVEVAVTVDDLPAHGPLAPGVTRLEIARRILDAFTRHHVPAVYGFVNGKLVDVEPDSVAILHAWLQAGYPLGNHSYSHTSLHAAELADYFADIERGEVVLKQLQPDPAVWKFFRYPYLFEGETLEKRNAARAWLHEHGYALAEVTIDANDWAYNPPFARCAEQADRASLIKLRASYVQEHVEELRRMRELTRALEQREVRQVLLLHLGVADQDALDELLTSYEREGVRWIDLPTALADPFFAQDPALPSRAGMAFPYRVALARGVSAPPPVFARDLEARLDQTCR
jgi:peptidoglycan/xylan/chitin deacetylase (PgdA/CDA1 family)